MTASVTPLTAHRLNWRLATAQAEGRLPSVVAAVVRDGGCVWSGSAGAYADRSGLGSGPDVQYRIGSITKTMTAVLILQLVRDGQLQLDQPVGDVLGSIGYRDRTLRQLLSHGSGMQAEPTGDWWERSAGLSWDELVSGNPDTGAVFAPGERYHYSNLGFALLGEVAARLIETTWWEAVRTRILAPLGLHRTSYLPERSAQGFSVHPWTGQLIDEPATDTGAMAAAGQLWATLDDLATYANFLIQGHPEVLSEAELTRAYLPVAGTAAAGLSQAHGLGFQLRATAHGTLVGHTGSMPGFLAVCHVHPSTRTGAVAFANATSGLDGAALAAALIADLRELEPPLPTPWAPSGPVPPEVAPVLGQWFWGATAREVSWESGEVVVRTDGEVNYRFRVHDGRLLGSYGYLDGETLHVVRRPDGAVSHLEVATFIWTRSPYDPAAPIPGGAPTLD